MILFGSAIIGSSIAASIISGGCGIDLLSFAVIYLGVRVRAGSRRAAWWGVVIMACYALSAIIAVSVAFLSALGVD